MRTCRATVGGTLAPVPGRYRNDSTHYFVHTEISSNARMAGRSRGLEPGPIPRHPRPLAACSTRPKQEPARTRTRVSTFREHACGRGDNVVPLVADGRVVVEVLDREPLAIVEDVKMAIGFRKDFAEEVRTVLGFQELDAIETP